MGRTVQNKLTTMYCLIHGSDGGGTEYTVTSPSATTWMMQAVKNTVAKINYFSAADE